MDDVGAPSFETPAKPWLAVDVRAWMVVHAVGILLIATALLKAWSPTDAALLEAAYTLPGWLVLLSVQAEIAVGAWLLSGWRQLNAWRTAMSFFCGFAVFSAYRALAGYESCGCFGTIKVNP